MDLIQDSDAVRVMTPSALQTMQVVVRRGLREMALSPRGGLPAQELKRGLLKHTLASIQDAKRGAGAGAAGGGGGGALGRGEGRPRTADAATLLGMMTPTKASLNEVWNPVPASYWSPWAPPADAVEAVQASLSCEACGREAPEIAEELELAGEQQPLVVAEACGHFFCAACLVKHVSAAEDAHVGCLRDDCPKELDVGALQAALDPATLEAYLDRALHAFLEADELVVNCPNPLCSEVMSLEEVPREAIDVPAVIAERDDAGRPLSEEAYVHFRQSRLRCRSCESDFCARCKELPYHKGYTCEGFRLRQAQRKCRFCDASLTDENTAPTRRLADKLDAAGVEDDAAGPAREEEDDDDDDDGLIDDVCTDSSCLERRSDACVRTLSCGHACGGVRGEAECPPCLHLECAMPSPSASPEPGAQQVTVKLPQQTADDYCAVCYVEDLRSAPCCHLACGHVFHLHCLRHKLEGRWPGKRITFGFMRCPLCAEHIRHPPTESPLGALLSPLVELYGVVKERALEHLRVDGLDQDARVVSDTGGKYYRNPTLFALDTYAFYACSKCRSPFFGGRRECEQNMQADDVADDELVCFECSDLRVLACGNDEHKEYVMWKCRYCCAVAVWFCFGSTHFCNRCHELWIKAKLTRRTKEADVDQHDGAICPTLGVAHPPNATEEFSLGCVICSDELRAARQSRQRISTLAVSDGSPRSVGGGGEEGGAGGDGEAQAGEGRVRRDFALQAQFQLVRSQCCVVC